MWKWPTENRLMHWSKKKYPHLRAQSVQQIVKDFCDSIKGTSAARKKGLHANYPNRILHYRDVPFTNQSARICNGRLLLPCGSAGKLRINMPRGIVLPGRLVEVTLLYGKVILVCQCDIAQPAPKMDIGIDLGVNTLVAATDGKKVLMISGHEAKATIQWRNKRLSSLRSRQSKTKKRSRRWLRIERRKHRLLDKSNSRIKDITHKATRLVADTFPGAICHIGQPFNGAAVKMGRVNAQQVSSACCGRITKQLQYKTAGTLVRSEAFSSQTCPVCGERCRQNGRVFTCSKCGTIAPRDVIGAVNMLSLGTLNAMPAGRVVPNDIQWVHPTHKYPGATRVVPEDTGQVARPVAAFEAVSNEKPLDENQAQGHIDNDIRGRA